MWLTSVGALEVCRIPKIYQSENPYDFLNFTNQGTGLMGLWSATEGHECVHMLEAGNQHFHQNMQLLLGWSECSLCFLFHLPQVTYTNMPTLKVSFRHMWFFLFFSYSSGTCKSCKFPLLFNPLETHPNWPMHSTAVLWVHCTASRQCLVLQCQSRDFQVVYHQVGNKKGNYYLNMGLQLCIIELD